MPDVESYFDSIDAARVRRVRELSDIKTHFGGGAGSTSLHSKAVLVLTYANWEGFYNECVTIFLDFLQEKEIPVTDVSWLLLTGALTAEFNALRDRNHSATARAGFVATLRDRIACRFDLFDRSTVSARSNLNFARLKENLLLFGFDVAHFERERIRIDKELVGWRHAVAHGSAPDLSQVDASSHVDFAANMMLTVSDIFQEAILLRL